MTVPLFVVRGTPTPEELAAVIAVVTTRAAGSRAPEPPARRSLWAMPVLPGPLRPGPGAWRASSLPR